MKVGFFQYDVIYRNREANLQYIASKIEDAKFDLLVLPEFFTSGYAFDNPNELFDFAENLTSSPTIDLLTKLAQRCGGFISGTIPEIDNNILYNTSVLVGPNGLAGYQRKIHLPEYEKRVMSSGTEIQTYQAGKARIGMMVCFDCWFAPLSSKLKILGAEIICHSACFGGEVTPRILPIRALENQVYVISCNRIGTELFNGEPDSYRGESQIIDPDGNLLIKAGNNEQLTFIDIDLNRVNHPQFGSLIAKDFVSEHHKYQINLSGFRLRTAKPMDIPQLKQLFQQTILSVNVKDYPIEEAEDWSTCGTDDERWNELLTNLYFIVAENKEGEIVGFASISEKGYLHSMYVHRSYQRQGIATLLYLEMERFARSKHIEVITSEVSITARPFFERNGFVVEQEQKRKANKLFMTNYKMSKHLSY